MTKYLIVGLCVYECVCVQKAKTIVSFISCVQLCIVYLIVYLSVSCIVCLVVYLIVYLSASRTDQDLRVLQAYPVFLGS